MEADQDSQYVKQTETQKVDAVRAELLSAVEQLAWRARRLVLLRSLLIWLSLLIAALSCILLLDYMLRREEFGLRMLALITWLLVAAATAKRVMGAGWRFSPTVLDVSRWIEQHRPDLSDRLSTAVQLAQLDTNDDRFGSKQFRNDVLLQWAAETHKPMWGQYLDQRRCWRALMYLLLLVAVVALGAMWKPTEVRIALQRMFTPWAVRPWPRVDSLTFIDLPKVVARGTPLQVEITDQSLPLPEDVRVEFRWGNLEPVQSLAATCLGDIAVANLPAIENAIEVRAVGGVDTQMSWRSIAVVDPPDWEQYRFVIDPPAYVLNENESSSRTNRFQAEELVGHRIQVLAGSEVLFRGTLSEAVQELTLRTQDPNGKPLPPNWQVFLGADGREVVVGGKTSEPMVIEDPMSWTFQVVTEAGLEVEQSQRWFIDVLEDKPPEVVLQTPRLNRQGSSAPLYLSGKATDDIGLASLSARLTVDGSELVEPLANVLSLQGHPLEQSVAAEWNYLDALREQGIAVQPGQQITYWLEAYDTLGQLGTSAKERLEIQSEDQFLETLRSQEQQLLKRMREMVEGQVTNARLASRTRDQIVRANSVEQGDVDTISGIAQLQRTIGRQLSEGPTSLRSQWDALKQDAERNQVADKEFLDHLDTKIRELDSVVASAVDAAIANSVEAQQLLEKMLQSASPELSSNITKQLQEFVEAQQAAEGALRKFVEQMGVEESLYFMQRELQQLADQQREVEQNTNQLQIDSLVDQADAASNSRVDAVAADQLDAALRLEQFLIHLQDLKVSGSTSALLERLERAGRVLVEEQVAGLMRQSSQLLGSDQYSDASSRQKQIALAFDAALQELGADSGRSTINSLSGQAADLEALGREFSELATAQAELAEQISAPDSRASQSELAQQQERLNQKTEASIRNAQTALADEPFDKSATAVQQLQRQASRGLEGGQLESAREAANNAAKELESLADQAGRKAERVSEEVQRQQLFQLGTALEQLVNAQRDILPELQDLAGSIALDGGPAHQDAVDGLVVEQEALRQTISSIRRQTDKLPAFDWTLEQVQLDMSRVVANAQRYRLEPEAHAAAKDALRKLELAHEAVQVVPAGSDSGEPQPEQGSEDQQNQRVVPPLASLKLFRGLQLEIQQQTLEVDAETDVGRKQARLRELYLQQQALGQKLEALLRELAAASDSNRD